MRWSRPAEASSHIQIIRPLLDVSKSLLREFAKQSRIAFREDASNADATFLRNRMRLEILPRLRSFQPAVDEIVLRTAEVLTAEKDFVETEARSWLDPDRPSPKLPFEALHKAVQREVMRRQLLNFAIQPTFDLIEELRNTPGRVITVSPGRAVSRSDAGVIEEVRPREEIFLHETLAIDASTGGSCGFGRLEFRWEHVEKRDPAEPGVEYFDAAKIGSRPELRTWVAGDRFWPIGLAEAAKVQDLLTNLKVPADEKRRRVVAVDSTGKIFWVEGLRISEQHKVTANTGLVLRWTWRPFQV
jgi:tRNA(Ile)-lysidine synthase